MKHSEFIRQTSRETCHDDLVVVILIYEEVVGGFFEVKIVGQFVVQSNRENISSPLKEVCGDEVYLFKCKCGVYEPKLCEFVFLSEPLKMETALPVVQVMRNEVMLENVINVDDRVGLSVAEFEQFFRECDFSGFLSAFRRGVEVR